MNDLEKLNAFECFWCKSTHLDKVSDDKYKCKACGNVNYKITDNDKIKFTLASTYMASYKYDDADKLYKELSESENTKTKVQALYGRLLSFFGVTYIKDFNGSLVVTFSNYKPEFSSITECSYYKDIINSEYKDEYINKLNELDTEYKRIKTELDKGIKYDIFICTKISLKTKDNPNLKGYTEDSIYASKIYDELTKKGLKVFYSDKVLSGIDYDAQIYSALMRSEKILVISSDREYLESAWVQSEWERWINFIKEDVKGKDSLYLFVPNNTPIELPRKLEKTQKFTDTLELVNRLAKNNVKETQVKVSINDLLIEAEYNLSLFKIEESEKIYEQVIRNYPKDYRGWLGLVDILIEKEVSENDKRYQRWLDKAIELADTEAKANIIKKYKKENSNEIKLEKEIKLDEQKKPKELEIKQTEKNESKKLESKDDALYKIKSQFLNNKTLGKYPQTQITDSTLINTLKTINNTNKLGYIEYKGNEYKELNGDYYLVEPIKWKILEQNNNTYKLVSDVILDQSVFYEDWRDRSINKYTVYPNNYEYSNIRAWLNGYDGSTYNVKNYKSKGFIDIAFTEEERKFINETLVDNSSSTTKTETNKYACNNTLDKVYLLSYQDVYKYFTSDDERQAKVTDYSEATGVYQYNENGDFWLHSPCDNYSYYAYYISDYGDISNYYVSDSSTGARPVIEITIR